MDEYGETLAAQQQRAKILVNTRCFPHCQRPVGLLDALCLVRGHGVTYYLRIRLPDGTIVPVRERDFNPQTMLWADV